MTFHQLLIRILNKLGLLQFLNLKSSIRLNHHRFIIPILGKIGIPNLYATEDWMIPILKQLLALEKGSFVDVGANVGQTLLKLRSVDPTRDYLGFEPNPVCNFYLKGLVEKNKLTKTKIIPVAVSTQNSILELEFYNKSETDSSASIINNFRSSNKLIRKEYVPAMNTAAFKENLSFEKIAVLKIDVEGAELEVLQCFQREIEKHLPIILIEMLPVYKAENTRRLSRQKAILALLDAMNYTIYRLILKEGKLLHLMKLTTIEIHSDLNSCEYMLVHRSKEHQIEQALPIA